jgi:hypothetical protein
MNMPGSWCGAIASAVLGCAVLSGPAASQSRGDTSTPRGMPASVSATMLRGGEMGELLTVYLPRRDAEIQRLLDDMRNLQRSAGSEVDETRRLASEADGRVRIMKEEIATTRVRRDVAKKAKDESARTELDATLKRQEREQDYLEHLRDALRADADRLDAERTASAARVKALELELQVAKRYEAIVATHTPDAPDEYCALLGKMLEAQKQSADKWRDASDRRKKVAERRLKQLQSLSKLAKS